MNRDSSWQGYHNNEIQNVSENPHPAVDYAVATGELQAWRFAQEGQYPRAAEVLANLINSHSDFTEIDQGWYLQLQADYLHHSDRVNALEIQVKAHGLNHNLLKSPTRVNYRKIQSRDTPQANAVREWMSKFVDPNALVAEGHRIVENLSFGVYANIFEQSFKELAEVFGFDSQRPEKEIKKGPDVLWQMTDRNFVVIEAKNQIILNREKIYKSDAEQISNSANWFIQTYPGESFIPVLIHPSSTLESDAFPPEGTKVILSEGLRSIVENTVNFVAALATKPINQWTTSEISGQISAYDLMPQDFLSKFLSTECT